MSPSDATKSEQYGPVSVELRCDFPGSEVLLVDGQQRLVGRAAQQLKVNVPPGVYKIRVLIGEALRDEPLVVYPDKPVSRDLEPPAVSSAIPMSGSAKSHEYHQDKVHNPPPEIVVHADGDSRVFVLLREWTSDGAGQRASGPLATTLRLRSADGIDVHAFNTDPADDATGDRAVAHGLQVRAGFYRLASHIGDTVVEIPIYTVANWQTQVYLLSQPTPEGLVPDFANATVLWAPLNAAFDPDREDLRVLESVRSAAEAGRHHLTDQGLTEALYEKYSNPMLGLISAHALLQRQAIEPGLLSLVTSNLEQMLGPIPDVIALKLAVNPDVEVAPVEFPPILRWSWQLLLRQSVDRPGVVRRYSLAEQVGSHLIGGGVWMSWMADAQSARLGSITQTATSEVQASAVRQAWQQFDRVNMQPSLSAESAGVTVESLSAAQRATSSRSRLERIVETLGVPCGVIEEAVGTAALTAANSADEAEQPRGETVMNTEKRKQFNERFLQRLLARRPQDRPQIEQQLEQEERRAVPEAALADLTLDPAGQILLDPRALALETIVNRERPVLFVRDGNFDLNEVTTLGPEAGDLVDRMKQQADRLLPLLPLIGRIDVVNFANLDFVGTGWFVDTDIVVTNRHVASLIARWDGRKFAFTRGVGGRTIESSFCNAHEFDDHSPDASRIFKVKEVLYIEPDSGPHDIAFLRVDRRTDGSALSFITVAASDAADEIPVCVIGYPARAPKRIIPDQALMKQLYRDRFDVKRAAPGFTSGLEQGSATHDCTTLGGNSGSVVLELSTGLAVGLHYAGIYEEDNFAVRASVLTDYIRRKRWNTPPNIETGAPAPTPASAGVPSAPAPSTPTTVAGTVGGSVSITIPITVTVSVGAPQTTAVPQPDTSRGEVGSGVPVTGPQPGDPGRPATGGPSPVVVDVARVEEVLPEFWDQRPDGVIAARVGYFDKDDAVGDIPCIAASVKPSELASVELGGPVLYKGVPVRYLPADVSEQVEALPSFEAVESIQYDDDARTGERFSFAPVNEPMEITLHVGPEYSWEILEEFLNEANGRMVSAIYEFHAPHIKDAIQGRLKSGASLTLVMDNLTFGKVKNPDEAFDRVAVFENWANKFTFNRIVAPEGVSGLISNAYHIKVTVRDDDTFWLSSGNWKAGSSQPIITQEQRDNATDEDLPGNREWHVVIKNKKLASRFRNHILQDFSRSEALGGGPLSKSLMNETLVDIPVEETIVLERRPPNRILPPLIINRKVKVRPLLTPDHEGAIYSEAVLGLIQSATQSLLFQIPYIGMPKKPNQDRGFIDTLIQALTHKLKTLEDARVLLRSGGSAFSSPAHAAWFFKSKGVDIDNRVKLIEDHHTKGMIVDGRRVLLGSHNWSQPGVSLNRDASLLFDDKEVAEYYTEAFNIDWDRANPVKPKRFVKEAVVLEAVGDAPQPGFQRVRLSDLVKDDD